MTGHSSDQRRAPSAGSTSRSMLAAARSSDPTAWTRLVTLYRPLVTAWCVRRGVAPQDVPDVVQDVFVAIAGNLGQFRKERPEDTFRGWLATIAKNKVHDYFRRRGGQPTAAGGTEAWQRMAQVCAEPSDATDDGADAEEFNAVLQLALAAICSEFHERTWQAFWRTVVEGRSTADVAAELGMQPGGVRVAKSRVLSRLRHELGDQPPSEQGASNGERGASAP